MPIDLRGGIPSEREEDSSDHIFERREYLREGKHNSVYRRNFFRERETPAPPQI